MRKWTFGVFHFQINRDTPFLGELWSKRKEANKVPALIADPCFFNGFYIRHLLLMCLKLWRRDDFVVLPYNRNVVFVPRYARKLFIDNWILLVEIFCKPGFGKPGFHTAFCALLSLFIGLSVCVCQLWLPVWLDFLSSLLCGSNDRRRTTHIFGFVLVTLSLLLREKKGVASEKRHVTA